MQLSVIFSTYNSPAWLEKVFWGLLNQSHHGFEAIVADDGSGQDTRELIEHYRHEFEARRIPLRHLWQRDDGFRKCRILNKAILAARHDYLVFTDGDCILRRDFLAAHADRAERGHFLSGSYYKLPMHTSQAIDRATVDSGACFDRAWLLAHGLPARSSRLKLTTSPVVARWANRLTPTRCNLKGANASAWRSDLLRVGGFDERMAWGGLDRELGVRLSNAGVKPRHVRYDAVCLHLDHARGYRDEATVQTNRNLRLGVARQRIQHTPWGLDRLDPTEPLTEPPPTATASADA